MMKIGRFGHVMPAAGLTQGLSDARAHLRSRFAISKRLGDLDVRALPVFVTPSESLLLRRDLEKAGEKPRNDRNLTRFAQLDRMFPYSSWIFMDF